MADKRKHQRAGDSESHEHERRPAAGFLDPRSWRLADVLTMAVLVFNLGVTVTRLSALEEWKQAHEARADAQRAAIVAKAEAEAKDAQRELREVRERLARLEAGAGMVRAEARLVQGGL